MEKFRRRYGRALLVVGVLAVGYFVGTWQRERPSSAFGDPKGGDIATAKSQDPLDKKVSPGNGYLLQSPGAVAHRPPTDWGLGDCYIDKLLPYPKPCPPGMRTPLDLWRYGGRGASSWGSPTLHMPWNDWVKMCEEQKPKLMADCQEF